MTGWTVQKIKVGALTITILPLGVISDHLREWFAPDAVTVPDGVSQLPVNCLHVSGPGISVLIDACNCDLYPGPGQTCGGISQCLEEAGIAPVSITHLILTHGHHDHFCGIVDPSNAPVFPPARHILSPHDWAKDTLNSAAQMADGRAADPSPLELVFHRGLLDLGESTVPLPKEFTLIDAPGETKGHRAVRLSSDGEVLYFLADLFHATAEIDDPGLCPLWADAVALKESRSRSIDTIRHDNARFLCSHIPRVFSADIFAKTRSKTDEAST